MVCQTRWIDRYRFALHMSQRGTVTAVGDGIASVTGLPPDGRPAPESMTRQPIETWSPTITARDFV